MTHIATETRRTADMNEFALLTNKTTKKNEHDSSSTAKKMKKKLKKEMNKLWPQKQNDSQKGTSTTSTTATTNHTLLQSRSTADTETTTASTLDGSSQKDSPKVFALVSNSSKKSKKKNSGRIGLTTKKKAKPKPLVPPKVAKVVPPPHPRAAIPAPRARKAVPTPQPPPTAISSPQQPPAVPTPPPAAIPTPPTKPASPDPVAEGNEENESRIPSVEDFLERFREQAANCLENAYLGEHEYIESCDDDTLSTTLCEDVFSLANIQMDVVHEYLLVKEIAKTDEGLMIVMMCLLCIIRNLVALQMQHRDRFLVDMESSCAAANDFMRFITCFDELMDSVHERYPPLKNRRKLRDAEVYHKMQEEGADLVALYGNDAVYTVQRCQIFVMKTIQKSSIPHDLFSKRWENEFVQNEVAMGIVHTMEDFLYDFHAYLSNEFLYRKIVGTLIQAMVSFYVKCLLQKGEDVRRKVRRSGGPFGPTESPFANPSRAVLRMMYDVQVFRTYFQNLVEQLPGLERLVEEELSVLVILHECFAVAAAHNTKLSALQLALHELVLVLHKRTGAKCHITRFIMQDLWLLAARRQQRDLMDALVFMDAEMKLLSNQLKETTEKENARDHLPGLRLKDVLAQFYEQRMVSDNLRPCTPCLKMIRPHVTPKTNRTFTPITPTTMETANTTTRTVSPALTAKSPTSISSSLLNLDFMKLHDESKWEEVSWTDVPPEEHEKRMKSLHAKLADSLKLRNIKFVTKTAANFEKRLKRRQRSLSSSHHAM